MASTAQGERRAGRTLRRRLPSILLAGVAVVFAAGAAHLLWEDIRGPALTERRLERRGAVLDERARSLTALLLAAADRAAALPEAARASAGDTLALPALFHALERIARPIDGEPVALAVYAPAPSLLAWTGRASDLAGLTAVTGSRRGVFPLPGPASTSLVATVPLRAPDGVVRGLATAELLVQQRGRWGRAEVDLLSGADETVSVTYLDARVPAPAPFPSDTRSVVLREPEGWPLALARLAPDGPAGTRPALLTRYRAVATVLLIGVIFAWVFARPPSPSRLVGALLLLRAVTLWPGWPLTSPALLGDAVYSSPILGPLSRSPLDLLLSAASGAALAALLLSRRLATPLSRARPLGALAAALLWPGLLLGAAGLFSDAAARADIDLADVPLLPHSAVAASLQLALLLVLAMVVLLGLAAFTLGGALPESRRARLTLLGLFAASGLGAWALGSRVGLTVAIVPLVLPLTLALPLLGGGAAPPLRSDRRQDWLGLAVLGVLLVALPPTLAFYSDEAIRARTEHELAPLVLDLPHARAQALAEACRRLDAIRLPLPARAGERPPALDELAFSMWEATDLGARGYSSALEIEDEGGVTVARFSLELPRLSASPSMASATVGGAWSVSRERVALASTEQEVLHARRRLSRPGLPGGTLHLFLAEDFSGLPFHTPRHHHPGLETAGRHHSERARLLVWDRRGRLRHASAERPPALALAEAERLQRSTAGVWSILNVDGHPHDAYLFSDAQLVYGLALPRRGLLRRAADVTEGACGLALLALVAALAALPLRAGGGMRSLSPGRLLAAVKRRLALRLFAALVTAAVLPLSVLALVVRPAVAERLRTEWERQALELATVARRAVEDYAFFQQGAPRSLPPVSDDALVWVASLVGNELDVFSGGRLLASSERELYASGLLRPRISGRAYCAIALEGVPVVLATEQIAGTSTLVASVPASLGGGEPAILSLPLVLRQREARASLDELDRLLRLASLGFLLLAALLARAVSRRISAPIRDLTQATRRIADGDLHCRVETRAQDELRDLVDGFNQMARDLEHQGRELERSHRLAAWAEMARQVAHEVKNPLTPIQLSAEHLRRVFHDRSADFGAALEACTATILRQVDSLRRIVTEFTAFARPPGPHLEPEDLGAIVREVLRPYLVALPPGVVVELDVPLGLPRAWVDRRLTERAVLNLVENALQAVGEKGTIQLRLRGREDRLELTVDDDGPGLDAEARRHLFEPFFSTKTTGSGLGLALVRKIVEDHGGGIHIEDGPHHGTRARLWFPSGRPGAAETAGATTEERD